MRSTLRPSPIVFGTLGLVFPLVQVLIYGTQQAHPALVLHWLMIPILAVPVAYTCKSTRYLELSTYLFAYVFFGLASTAQLMVGAFPLVGSYEIQEVLWADALILAGLMCFASGAHSARGARAYTWSTRPVTDRRVWRATVMAAISFAGVTVYLGSDISLLFMARHESFEQMALLTGAQDSLVKLQIATSLLRIPILVASVAALTLALLRGRVRMLATALVLLNLIVNNPISTPRFLVGSYAIAYLLIAGLRFFPLRLGSIYAVGMPLVFVLMFPLIDVFRASLDATLDTRDVFTTFATKADFDSFQLVMDGGRFVAERGITGGQQILGALAYFVPRAIWSEKPEATGILLGQWGNRSNVNLAAPLWIEFYIDAWWFGLAAGMSVAGRMCRRLQTGLSANRLTVGAVVVPLLAGYLMILLRGSLMTAVSFLVPMLAFSILCSGRASPNGTHAGGQRNSIWGAIALRESAETRS